MTAIPGLSAGTGPAALILDGVVMVLLRYGIGWGLVAAGIGLSAFWALRFK